ncbi:hypothetical protein QBE52_04865 [Clostridiaceae bacterium 35-E11]
MIANVVELKDLIAGWFSDLITIIVELKDSIAGWFSDLITRIIELPSLVFTAFKDFLIGKFDFVAERINAVKDVILSLPSLMLDGIKGLFVPSDTFFSEKINTLQNTLESRLSVSSYISVLETVKNLQSSEFSSITGNVMGREVVFLDASIINSVLPTIRKWIKGVMFVLLAIYNYRQVYRLIRGSDYIPASGKSDGQGQQLTFWGVEK